MGPGVRLLGTGMLRWCESFGHGNVSQHNRKWVNGIKMSDGHYSDGNLGAFHSSFTSGRLAGQNAYITSGFFTEVAIQFLVGASNGDEHNTWITGFAHKPSTHSGNVVHIDGSGGKLLILTHAGDGRLRITLDGTTLGFTESVLSINKWYYIEMRVDTSWASDILSVDAEVRINGVTSAVVSGSVSTTQTGYFAFQWGGPGGGNTNNICDIYVCDGDGTENNDFLGDVNIVALLPESDGTHTGWTTSTGTTHYTLVDENPADTSDYVHDADSTGVKESFNYPALNFSGEVKAVVIAPFGLWDGTGSATSTINRLIVTSGTDYELTDYIPGFQSSTSFGLSFAGPRTQDGTR